VGAGAAALLDVFRVGAGGLGPVATRLRTAEGARNAVGDDAGNVHVVDPQAARLLVYAAPRP